MGLAESVLQEIQLLVACGFENRESLYFRIFQTMGEELGLADEVTTIENLDAPTRSLLRDAIEQAFTRNEEQSLSWPATTDCDRLHRAFDVLNNQGIVALENCGSTQDDGIHRAALLSVARDELGNSVIANDGYCFFHEQDAMHAVEGDGLWLAFGTFKDESQDTAPGPNRLATPAAKPPSGHAQQVGESVVKACRDAGLNVVWNGSPATRIHLPAFRWQRRMSQASDSEIDEFIASWELEIRAGYTAADEVLPQLEERAGDWFAEFANFGPKLLERLRAHTKRFLEEERARETTWAEATLNDRMTAAFVDLRERQIFAAECLGLTIQDGWGYVGLDASAKHRGAVFFHHEDVIDAVNGQGLFLAYGALPVNSSGTERASLALAQEIVSVLDEHGIPSSWGRSIRERIRIAPFEWRRRRWTKPPSHDRRPTTAPKSPSLWSRMFGGSSGARPAPPSAATSAGQFAEVVRAVRNENGFDLRRAKRMRAAWKNLAASGEGQVGHLGLPHIFVPTGEFTTMKPVPALENLCEDKNEIFLRAAKAKSSGSSNAEV